MACLFCRSGYKNGKMCTCYMASCTQDDAGVIANTPKVHSNTLHIPKSRFQSPFTPGAYNTYVTSGTASSQALDEKNRQSEALKLGGGMLSVPAILSNRSTNRSTRGSSKNKDVDPEMTYSPYPTRRVRKHAKAKQQELTRQWSAPSPVM